VESGFPSENATTQDALKRRQQKNTGKRPPRGAIREIKSCNIAAVSL
jgi:hypothetical protein